MIKGKNGTTCEASARDTIRGTVTATTVYEARPIRIRAVKMQDPFTVNTMEGTMTGKAGDYLVEGIEGELYPCDASIFERKYEPVE